MIALAGCACCLACLLAVHTLLLRCACYHLPTPDLPQEAGEAGLHSKPSYPTTAQPERKRPRPPSDSTPPRRSASRSRSRSRSRDRHHHGDRPFPREDTRENNYGTIFVGNISHDTNENTLRDFFETYGRVASAKVRPRNELPPLDPIHACLFECRVLVCLLDLTRRAE